MFKVKYQICFEFFIEGFMRLTDTTAQNSFKYGYLLKRISKYILPYWDRILLNFLIAIPVGLLDGVVAYALRPYMDEVIGKGNEQLAFWIPFAIIFFALFQGTLRYLNTYLTDWTGMKVTNAIKLDLFKKLLTMDTRFFQINSSGIILGRFLGDADTASKGILDNIKTLMATGAGTIALIGVMLYNSWQLAIVGVVVLVFACGPAILIRKRIKRTSNACMTVGGVITTNFNETCGGNRIITSYGLQDYQYHKLENQIHEAFDLSISLTKRVGWMSPIMYLIASFGIAIVMCFGNHLILTGQMTSGSFASFVTSLLLLYKPIKTLGNTLTGLQTIFVSMGRVFELFDLVPEIQNRPEAKTLDRVSNDISFEHVYFQYEEGIDVLKDVSIDVKVGETLALVGNSGGGKTTFVNLLPRFYDIYKGSIKIDGIDIRDYTLESLRNNISIVFQDNFLFSGTIRDNIMMGNFGASEEKLEEAIKGAHLDEFLSTLPNGVDTVIGERGTTLSGGQRQRVAIARAMLKDSAIVILDEATSALDNKSEAIVQKALENLMRNRTVFVIAHRLSTIQNADKIAVVNDGKIVEVGTHEQLLSKENGAYRTLYFSQFNKEAVTA